MVDTFPAGHYYSPLPDIDSIQPQAFIDTFAGLLCLDEAEINCFSRQVYSFSSELARQVNSGSSDFKWSNSQFPPADAMAYYGILRALKPSKVIEIGSGFSTQVAIEAIRANHSGDIICIEPYPSEYLKDQSEISLIIKKQQEISNDIFTQLRTGDVFFVDSTHQAKCQSDVLDIFFRVFDLLKPGVFIHLHDIFYPDDYPYFWLKENGLFFNEQYFLIAFLKDNPNYRIRLPNAYLVRKCRSEYEKLAEGIHQPENESFVNLTHKFIKAASFWIEKIA